MLATRHLTATSFWLFFLSFSLFSPTPASLSPPSLWPWAVLVFFTKQLFQKPTSDPSIIMHVIKVPVQLLLVILAGQPEQGRYVSTRQKNQRSMAELSLPKKENRWEQILKDVMSVKHFKLYMPFCFYYEWNTRRRRFKYPVTQIINSSYTWRTVVQILHVSLSCRMNLCCATKEPFMAPAASFHIMIIDRALNTAVNVQGGVAWGHRTAGQEVHDKQRPSCQVEALASSFPICSWLSLARLLISHPFFRWVIFFSPWFFWLV